MNIESGSKLRHSIEQILAAARDRLDWIEPAQLAQARPHGAFVVDIDYYA